MAILKATALEKRYGGVHALKGVDFELRSGEVHALLGENGAGKSTLIKILAGMVSADAGRIEVDGHVVPIDSVTQAHALGIQTVHQELELAPPLSVAENIFMGRLPGRRGLLDPKRLRTDAAVALARIGADFDPQTLVASLSISDRQVVEIVRAIVRDGRFLILDEPTAALPPREVDRLMEVIRRLTATGVGVVYVSHRLDEVLRIADRVTVLRDGRSVASLDRAEIDRPMLIRHILGRELAEFAAAPAPARGEVGLECERLAASPELKDLSFRAHHGEVLAFFGLLGAGQGSIGDALLGLRAATATHCRLGGRDGLPDCPQAALARGLGYVPADRKGTGLLMPLSVMENLLLTDLRSVSRMGILDEGEMTLRANDLIGRYNIRCSGPRQIVQELSGGNQQKVAVGKWAARKVRSLFLDEPTRGVDVGAKVEIYRFLKSFAAEGGCCLVSSSDPAEIVGVADRAIVLRDGVPVLELTGADITEATLVAAAL